MRNYGKHDYLINCFLFIRLHYHFPVTSGEVWATLLHENSSRNSILLRRIFKIDRNVQLKRALRVCLAVTRLTVYRRLTFGNFSIIIFNILIFLTIQSVWNQFSHIIYIILLRLHLLRPPDYVNMTGRKDYRIRESILYEKCCPYMVVRCLGKF